MNVAMIKELRDRTGVGFGDCKKALVEADWDLERAVDAVRRQSGAKADKKAGRTAAEGLLGLATEGARGALVEVNVETDFAARNPKFEAFVRRAAALALAQGADGVAPALEPALEEERKALVQEIGENVQVRRAVRLIAPAGGVVAGYLHQDRKKAALVSIGLGTKAADGQALAREVAMHVTAMRPLVVRGQDMPAELVARERAIYQHQASESGKPAPIVEKMVSGRLRKFLAESSLLEQPFVKDADTTVGKLLAAGDATCEAFERFEVGEGIQKEEEDFAAEVYKQVGR